MTDYHKTLGEFVETFASVETALSLALWRYARTPVPIAQAIFSGTRIDGAIQTINRILEVTSHPKSIKEDLEYIFSQLKHITTARNLILHYGSIKIDKTDRLSTNIVFALTEERVKSQRFSAEILNDMIFDLNKIQMHLIVNHHDREPRLPPPYLEAELDALDAAWRYTPPPQAPHRNSQCDTSPKRKRPRKPSHE